MNPKWYEEEMCWQKDCKYPPGEKKIKIDLLDGGVAFANKKRGTIAFVCLKHLKDPDEG